MKIKPIETSYAGFRFRSRLEARWAVAFDKLGAEWQYEPQGFEIENRLNLLDCESWPYLPDFLLPQGIPGVWDQPIWAEVKGSLTHIEAIKVISTAAYLSAPGGGCGGGDTGDGWRDTVILSDIPKAETGRVPGLLHLHKGDLLWNPIGTNPCNYTRDPMADDGGTPPRTSVAHDLLCGFTDTHNRAYRTLELGYGAARKARFEHGQKG